MCRGRPPAPPPPPPPRPIPPPPEPTAGRVVTGDDRRSIRPRPTGSGATVTGQQRAAGMTAGSRRSTRGTTARRLGTSSLRIPLLSSGDLNYPV
tara:strand:+ start:2383 stop:2664 length:282 start_codon:yes stop_codon:yes gene_type:complete